MTKRVKRKVIDENKRLEKGKILSTKKGYILLLGKDIGKVNVVSTLTVRNVAWGEFCIKSHSVAAAFGRVRCLCSGFAFFVANRVWRVIFRLAIICGTDDQKV